MDIPNAQRAPSAHASPQVSTGSVIADAIALLVSKAGFIGIRLLFLYGCAKDSSSESFGLISFSFVVAETVRIAADWGVDTYALRQFSSRHGKDALLSLARCARIKYAASLIAFAGSLLLIRSVVGLPDWLLAILIAATSASSIWLNLGVNWLQARGELRAAAFLVLAAASACAALLLAGSFLEIPPRGRAVCLIGFECVSLTILLSRLPAFTAQVEPHDSEPWVSDWLRAATPIAVASLLAIGYSRAEQFYLRSFGTATMLGDYSLANRIVEPFLFVAAAFSSTAYARLSSILSNGQRAVARRVLMRWARLVAAYVLIAALVLGGFGLYVLPSQFPNYAQAGYFLTVSTVALVFRCSNLLLTACLQSMGLYALVLKVNLMNFVTIGTLLFTLGYLVGPATAVLAVAIGEAINTATQGSLVWRRLRA